MVLFKKVSVLAVITALATTAGYAGGKIERAGLKVAGESVWVPGVQVRDNNGNIFNITTERYAEGRSLEGDFQVFPDSAFNVHDYGSVARFVQGQFDVTFLESKPGKNRAYDVDVGIDGIAGTADDSRKGKDESHSENGW